MNKYSYIIKKKIKGPIFSIITPFKIDGNIDYISLKNYIKFLYINGAKVFYVMFYNSRLGLLSEKEILNVNKFCIDSVKKLDKENIIICAEPYHCSTKQTLEYVKYFEKCGADIVSLIFGEKFYNEKQILDHFKAVHNKTKIYLLLHQQLIENGISGERPYVYYSIKLLNNIMSLKRFIAMKEDAKKDIYTRKICRELSKKVIIITSGQGKQQWIKASKHGCQSWLSGISNLNPRIAIDFYKDYNQNDLVKVKQYIKYLEKPFYKIVKKYGWHLTIKAFLELNGNFKRYERQPMTSLKSFHYKKIKKLFLKISDNCKKNLNKNYFKI